MELLLGECLSSCPLTGPSDLRSGIFAATLALYVTKEKKRFTPEIWGFLQQAMTQLLKLKVITKEGQVVDENSTGTLKKLGVLGVAVADSQEATHEALLNSLLKLVQRTAKQYTELPAFSEAVMPMIALLTSHSGKKANKALTEGLQLEIESTLELLVTCQATAQKRKRPLRLQSAGVKTIATLNPDFNENYTLRKDQDEDRDKAQAKQLKRQLKRERKGAARELRRDAVFLAREKFKEEEQRNTHRKAEQQKIQAWVQESMATFNQQVRKGGGLIKGGGSTQSKDKRARLTSRRQQ